MGMLKITLLKSTINRPQRQKATVVALGLKKLHQSVILEESPQIAGMIEKVNHLVEVEQV